MVVRAHKFFVVLGQTRRSELYEVRHHSVINAVDVRLVFLQLLTVYVIALDERAYRQLEVFLGKLGGVHNLLLHLRHGNRRSGKQAVVNVAKAEIVLFLRGFVAHNELRNFHELLDKRQQHRGGYEVEREVEPGNLPLRTAEVRENPHHLVTENPDNHGEHNRSHDIEQNVEERRSSRIGVRAYRRDYRRHAGADIGTENDEQAAVDAHRSRSHHYYYKAGGRRRALNNARERHADKYQKKRKVNDLERVLDRIDNRRFARKRAAHGLESHEHKSQTAQYAACFLDVVVVEERHHDADEGEQRGVKVYVQRRQRNHEAGKRRSDVRAHDYRRGLRQRDYAGVDKSYRHNGGRRRAVDDDRHQRAYAYACETVAREMIEQLFHLLAGAALQAVAHHLHAYHKDAATGEKHHYTRQNFHYSFGLLTL